ncbi:MAG: F0F1 ATP synthase subunit B [Candidatus Pacebacteria bacterium]|nr:F0F1 ATP synthase subunit B [Candidatus Paceibacterota bacterium]
MEEIASVFGLNWKLLLIQAVNFGVLLLVLRYFLYTPVLKMLDERREKVEKGVKDAEAAGVRIQEIEDERDGVLKEASNEASNILSNSKERSVEQASQITTDANAQAETILESANLRSQELKEQALRESKEEIGKAAILAAEVILRDKK